MSEFFKALEQAERDREVAERNEKSVSRSKAQDAEPPDDADVPVHGPATPAVDVVVSAAVAAEPVAAPPPTSRPGDGKRSVFDRPSTPAERPRTPHLERPAARGHTAAATPAEPPQSVSAERPQVRPSERRASPPERQAPPPERGGVPPAEPSAKLESDPPPLQRVTLPRSRRAEGPVLIADLDPRSVAAEAYRTLRANLEFMPSERGCRNIVVTSPSMGEGKSTTVANLAVVAAQAGTRVCLVDADMRRPAMHRVFDVPNTGGFTRALSQAMPLASVAVPTAVAHLSLVVAGSADGLRSAQLLNAPRLQKVLHDPATPFDLVLFDTPPIISVSDAMNLAAHCDGVVLVVRAGAVPPSVLQQAVRQIEQVKGKVLGVLLNQVDFRRGEAEFYRYYRAYHSTPKRD